MLGCHTTCWRR